MDGQFRQVLLQITTDHGTRLGFATLGDGRCAIVRDSTIVHVADSHGVAAN